MRKQTDDIEDTKRPNLPQKSGKSKNSIQINPLDRACTLLEVMKTRRAIRFFEKTPIPEEHLTMILEGARWAPSPSNAQPWILLVIKDQRVKRNLMKTMKKVGEAVREKYTKFPWDTTPRDPELISKVPVIIAVCADYNRAELRKYDAFPLQYKNEIIDSSMAVAIQNMMLMAAALGIGSLWITPFSTEAIRRLLKIPETLRLVALVALGYSLRCNLKKTSRHPLEKLVYYDEIKET